MENINILKNNVYSLIAAGEVVLNPSCVVKELVENSIDAKASYIKVEIKNGGKSLIRVIDDGVGIKNSECKLAFLNHSTSKILNEEDLNEIKTLGFRGEALYSIAAVSKVLITTKQKKESLGCCYSIEAGEEKSFEKINCSDGTTIEVHDIFYNVPARLKFLKKDFKEAFLVQNILEKLALSNTKISFELKKDGKTVMQTFGSLNEKDVIYNIFGKEFCENLMELSFQNSYVKIKGFVSSPSYFKSYRSIQHIFVNGRSVKCRFCVNAVEEAFKGSIVKGKFPCFLIYLTVPLQDVDVNVHPNKIEVRFAKEKEILNAICFATREAIFKKNNSFLFEKTLNLELENKNEQSFEIKSDVKEYEIEKDNEFSNFKYISATSIKKNYKKQEEKLEQNLTKKQNEMLNSIVLEEPIEYFKKNNFIKNVDNVSFNTSKLRVVGEIFKLYILAEIDDNFIIIDKHAAHEKMLYNKLKNNEKENLERQILLSPIKFSFKSVEECEMVLEKNNVFLKFGFLIEPFQGNTILIREIPLILADENCKDVFEEIAFNIKNNKKYLTPEKLDKIYSIIACKGAIKAHEDNSEKELEKLVEKTYFDVTVRNCPHGRPALLVYKKERFDKKFGRK